MSSRSSSRDGARPRWSFDIRDPDLVEGVMRIVASRAGFAVIEAPVAGDEAVSERTGDGTRELHRARRRLRLSHDGEEVAAAVIGDRVVCSTTREELSRGSQLEIEAAPTAADRVLRLLAELASARCIDPLDAPLAEAAAPNDATDVAATPAPPSGAARVPASVFARESVAERIEEFLRHAPAAGEGGDALTMLEARDAARRLRAALGLFHPWLPTWLTEVGPRLDPVLTSLDAIRTLGVQIERLAAWREELDVDDSVRKELGTLLRAQYERATGRLRDVFGAASFAEVETVLRGAAEEPPETHGPTAETIGEVCEQLLAGRFRRYRDHGISLNPDSPPSGFHRLLALCETLGFALERTAVVLGDVGETGLRALSSVHERLLRHQDADLAAQHLRLLAERTRLASGAAGAFAFGQLAERHRRRGRLALDGFAEAFLRTTGARWQRLTDVLQLLTAQTSGEQLRPTPPPDRL